jgi:hypothetical protein
MGEEAEVEAVRWLKLAIHSPAGFVRHDRIVALLQRLVEEYEPDCGPGTKAARIVLSYP